MKLLPLFNHQDLTCHRSINTMTLLTSAKFFRTKDENIDKRLCTEQAERKDDSAMVICMDREMHWTSIRTT